MHADARARRSERGTHSDLQIEYPVAVINGDDMILDKPCRKPRREDVQGEKVATQKKENLKHVETEKGMPEPASHRSLWLKGPRGRERIK